MLRIDCTAFFDGIMYKEAESEVFNLNDIKSKILVIEDDEHISELIRFNLEIAGNEVLVASDGLKGLQMALNERPDLVLLDVMLPGLDGMQVLKRLREDSKTSLVPVIMLTAKGTEMDKVMGLELGADDYVTKPFSLSELMARVKAHIRREKRWGEKKSADSIVIGNVTLEQENFRVFADGEEVKLSLKEFEMLKLLMLNRGKVLSRDELLNEIWGYDYFGETRTVDVHIRYLRKKLGDEEGRLIETVRGVGYRIGK